MALLLNGLFSLVVFLLVLGILVVVHEFGHYLAGRLQGFGIDAFSVGFGPRIAEVKGAYNRWQFRWLLFGGYVKFRGETGDEEAPADAGPGEFFYRMPRWRRFFVLIAGVAFNIALAYLLFAGLVMIGVEESVLRDQPPRIGWVAPDSPAQRAGILPGDVLVAFDGRRVHNWDQAREEIFTLTQKPYPVTYERGGRRITVSVTPEKVNVLHQPAGEIGIFPALPPVIGGVADPSPAFKAGLKPGDRILSLDGRTFSYWDEFQQAMAAVASDQPRRFVVERGGEKLEFDIAPQWSDQMKRYLVGVTPQETTWVRYPFPLNFGKAFSIMADQSTLAYRTIKRIIENKTSLSSLSGPVSIAYITGEVARTGLYNLLWLLAIISLQLGLFNLLPIPGLDGGQLLILVVESAVRKDLPLIVKERILQVGFGLLIVLLAVILVLDVAKFFH
jgi:regulator of sigma E protease